MRTMERLPALSRCLWLSLARAALLFIALATAPGNAAAVAPDGARMAAVVARRRSGGERAQCEAHRCSTWANYIDHGPEWARAANLFADDAELAHGDDRFMGAPTSLLIFAA
jgi:hypothetical protein